MDLHGEYGGRPAPSPTSPARPESAGSFGLILAGGRSRRFGSRKAVARLGGIRLIDRVIAAHRQVFSDVLVVTQHPDLVQEGDGVRVIPDLQLGSGPLGGLHAGLLWGLEHGAAGACCTPCDAPFVAPALFGVLLENRADNAAVLPVRDAAGHLEPLFGWYSCRLAPAVEAALASDDRSLRGLARRLPHVRYLGPDELPAGLDPDRLFFNVNSPVDVEIAHRYLASAEA